MQKIDKKLHKSRKQAWCPLMQSMKKKKYKRQPLVHHKLRQPNAVAVTFLYFA